MTKNLHKVGPTISCGGGQNQGDPAGSPWFASSGTWQDGEVAVRGVDGYWNVFLSKFSTQLDKTDEAGHPA